MPTQPASISGKTSVRCCIVGGGPAGMMLGYLLARAGIETLVLEKHADFLRDFRGDTVHPSTLAVLDELGLLEEFLQRPHQKLSRLTGDFGGQRITVADCTRLKTKCRFIAFMPQWEFLNFLAEKCAAFPHFRLVREATVTDLLIEGNRVTGVRATTPQGPLEAQAHLTVGCDGRHSVVRERAGLKVEDLGAPIDVLWFRVTRTVGNVEHTFMYVASGRVLVTLDRGDYWQCAYVVPKGGIDDIKKRGLETFRQNIVQTVPLLRDHVAEIKSWDDVKLLSVAVDRLTQWSRSGLLCIGDSAHAMSPIGGVGINLAIQDAVAAANLLAGKLAKQQVHEHDLEAVQHRRLWPTKMTQALQIQIQNRVLAPVISGKNQKLKVPFPLRLINAWPWLQGMTARFIGLGFRPEHIHSPDSRSTT